MAEQKRVVAGRDVSTYISPFNRDRRAYYDLFESFKEITDYTRRVEEELVSRNEQWQARRDFVDNGGSFEPSERFTGSNDRELLSNPTEIT